MSDASAPVYPFVRSGILLDACDPARGLIRHVVTTCTLAAHGVTLLLRSELAEGLQCVLQARALDGAIVPVAGTATSCVRRLRVIHQVTLATETAFAIERFIEPTTRSATDRHAVEAEARCSAGSAAPSRVLLVGAHVRSMPWLAETIRAVGRVPAVVTSAAAALSALRRAHGVEGIVLALEGVGHDAALRLVTAIREHGFRGPVVALGTPAAVGDEIRIRGGRSLVIEDVADELTLLAALGSALPWTGASVHPESVSPAA